jgi:hypothetical protein
MAVKAKRKGFCAGKRLVGNKGTVETRVRNCRCGRRVPAGLGRAAGSKVPVPPGGACGPPGETQHVVVLRVELTEVFVVVQRNALLDAHPA